MVNGKAADLAGRRIALTGAGGFLGRAVARELLACGAEVRGLLRQGHEAVRLAAACIEPVVAPLRAGPALARAMEGCDTLVHLAYDLRADAATNLAMFDAAMAAAGQAGITRIVHASSIVVYDDWPAGEPISETAPIGRVPAAGYRQAKISMEDRLLSGAIPAAVLQPTIVWGPGSDQWTTGPMRQLRHGGLVLPDPCGRAPLVHVDDVARAFALAAGLENLGQERFIVNGPEAPGWDALFEGYAALCGGTLLREDLSDMRNRIGLPPADVHETPPGLAATVSRHLRALVGRRRFDALRDRVLALRPASGPTHPNPFLLSLYAASPQIDSPLARNRLGFEPVVNLAAGLAMLRQQ